MSAWPIVVTDHNGVARLSGKAKGTPPPPPPVPQTVLSETVNVTRAQLLAFNNPVPIVAGVAGKMVMPLGGVVEYVAGSTPYTDHGCAINLFWNTGDGDLANDEYFTIPGQFFWDQATSQVAPIVPNNPTPVRNGWSKFANRDLVVGSHEAARNPTLGNGTLRVTVFYCLATVTP